MKGSAFIVHNGTWSCSNEVALDIFTSPNIVDGKYNGTVKQEQTLTVFGIFNASQTLIVGDKCEMVFLPDNEGDQNKYGFMGIVKAVGKLHTIINIFTKSERISEILSNITFKN